MQINVILKIMSFFYVFVKGIKNMTQTEVIDRIKQANKVSDIFKNYYGTCALNTMLFLNTIDLQIFEELSINMMKTKSGLATHEISLYLNSYFLKFYF